jgi:ATP-dependent RNA helicase SUPV3L1/SUV3
VVAPDGSESAIDVAAAESAAEVVQAEAAGVPEAEIMPAEAIPTAVGEESHEEVLQPIAESVTAEASTGTETSAPVPETAADAAPAETPPELLAAEPVLVEVWRPGRTEGRRRPRPARRESGQERGRQPFRKRAAETPRQRSDETGASVAAAGETVAAPPAEPISAEAMDGPKGEVREERHSRQRHRRQGGGKHFGGENRPDRPHRERERQPNRPARFERREKAPDPNSPFAKLAALKAQLEADAKERR